MADRTLLVRIVGDDSSLQRTFQRNTKGAQTFGLSINDLGKNFLKAGVAAGAAAVSFEAVTAIVGDSVNAAVALNEETAKSEQLFGDSSKAVQKWATTTADAFGIARVDALAASGQIGALLLNMGLLPEAASETSRKLVELAADMASFNNADPSEVLLAMQSGLRGESEPLSRFAVDVREARVQQQALIDTGKDHVSQLTAQEKAQARINTIFAQTVIQQGDVERTSGSLANQQRRLRAQFKDLETNLGSVLIPTLTTAAEAANLLFDALDKFRGVDFSPGFDFPDPPDWLKDVAGAATIAPISPLGAAAVAATRLFKDDEKKVSVFDEIAASLNKTLGNLARTLDKRAEQLRKVNAAAERSETKRFDEHMKGLGLKLDKAGLTATLSDDLSTLREMETSIQRRIRAEGRTFELEQDLTNVRSQILSKQTEIAGAAADATRRGWDDAIDALELKLDMAKATRGFADDLRALKAIERQILERMRAEGRTVDLMRQLFENRQAQKQALRDQRTQEGFEALGLTDEGDRPTPSGAALLKRAKSLREQIKGTILDTPKTRRDLRRIVDYLKTHLRSATKEVREAILGMLNDISSAFEQDKPRGPLTKFAKTGIGKLIEGLGLTNEQVRELRSRMSAVGPGMSVPLKGTGAFGSRVGRGAEVGPARGPREDEFVFHIYIDGQEVESTVTRRQQRKQGRNGRSRRGTRPGR